MNKVEQKRHGHWFFLRTATLGRKDLGMRLFEPRAFVHRAGFTLLETLVTMAIIIIMTGAVYVTVRTSARPQAVGRTIHTTLLAIRTAQAKAASTVTLSPGQIPYGYGVYFNIANRGSIIIFADLDGDKTRKSDATEDVQTIALPGVWIESLRVCFSATSPCSSVWQSVGTLTAYFCPPNPNTFLFGSGDTLRNPGPPPNCAAQLVPPPPPRTRTEVRVMFRLPPGSPSLPASTPRCLRINAAGAAFVDTGQGPACP